MPEEYIGHGIAGEPYGLIERYQPAAGEGYWRLDEEASWFEDPYQGGNSGLHHIFVDALPWEAGRVCHIHNTGVNQEFHETLIHPPGSGHIAQLEFPMWGAGNVYDAQMEGAGSDAVTGMLMPGNVHVSYHLVFEWTVSDAPPVYDTLREALLAQGEAEQVIQFNPNAALQQAIFAAGFVPNSGEFHLDHEGARYVGQRAEHLGTGAVRIYYATLGDWNNVRFEER